jgi:hypothetical protein
LNDYGEDKEPLLYGLLKVHLEEREKRLKLYPKRSTRVFKFWKEEGLLNLFWLSLALILLASLILTIISVYLIIFK